jgi:L-fuconolactonase
MSRDAMTERFVIDAHQHIWDKDRAPYPWLTESMRPVDRAFAFDDLRPQLDAAGVSATVLVQSSDSREDTALMLECAAAEPRVVGVVGWAPLDRPDEAAPLFERYRADPVVVGVRALIHDMPDPRWLQRDDVREGLALLERAGLTFDVVAVLPEHLECAIDVGERFPDLRLVIDHLGHPSFDGTGQDRWRALIAEVAGNPRAAAKVSGLYPDGGPTVQESRDRIRPVLEHALAAFGAHRLLYGGDWPISVLHGGYTRTWDVLAPLIDALPPRDAEAVLHGSAERIYSIDPGRLSAVRRAVDA